MTKAEGYCRWVYPADGSPRFWVPGCMIGACDRDTHCLCRECDEERLKLREIARGCICPPGSEATCLRQDCGRK